MGFSLKKLATQSIKLRYKNDWKFKEDVSGIQLTRDVNSSVRHHIFYSYIKNDSLGLRVQVAVGGTLSEVNAARDLVVPRHAYTIDGVTAFFFLNSLLQDEEAKRDGWVFKEGENFQGEFNSFVNFVDRKIQESNFFQSLQSLDDYIACVKSGRWKFITIFPTFLYALLAKGEKEEARRLATVHRAEVVKSIAERGFTPSKEDTLPYDQIIDS